jgi:hypothetical protein
MTITVEDDWLGRAACRGRTQLFYASDDFSHQVAVAICQRCPVRPECEDETRRFEATSRVRRFGVRAGFTAEAANLLLAS